MRLIGLTRYSRLGASSRLRSFQYEAAWNEAGIESEWCPLFDDAYLVELYRHSRRRVQSAVRSYLGRLRALGRARHHDLVWLEKEALPWLPSVVDPGLLRAGPPYVVDYDDAVFHYYDQSTSASVRWLLGSKISKVMRHAALVVAGNPYLAQYARDAGAARIEIVPTVVDLHRYELKTRLPVDGLAVGWIGSPSTQPMIEQLAPVLKRALAGRADRLITVGARFDEPLLPCHEVRAWTEASEVDEIRRFDVGVMPLVDRPFERGKCGYKLIQYMACGLPVVASPVGVNVDIVQHGINGYLARNEDEWMQAIVQLRADEGLRARMGAAGRALVASKYSLQVTAPRLGALLHGVVNSGGGKDLESTAGS